jgi:hypothetical protein
MFSNVLSVIGYSLDAALLLLVISRNLRRRLPVFTLFVALFVARDIATLFIVYWGVAGTETWSCIFWTSEILLNGMYLFIITEIAKLFFCDYPSIWRSASRLLDSLALAFTSWAVYSAFRYFKRPHLYLMVGEQRLLLTVTILILIVMAIGAYYRLKLPPLYRFVLVGIGIYAAVQVATDQIVMQYQMVPNPLWDLLRRGPFLLSIAVWSYGVWRWAGPQARQVELITQSKYDDLSPRVHDRLHEANLKLANLTSQRP